MKTQVLAATLVASRNPKEDIKKIAYEGQPAHMRMYKPGYEEYFETLPAQIEEASDLFFTQEVMQDLSDRLKEDGWLTKDMPESFDRTIIALESPEPLLSTDYPGGYGKYAFLGKKLYKEGKELVIARWADGHTSPVHGHSPGYMHEEILTGKMRVNTYRITDRVNRIVRPIFTQIIEPGVFVSKFVDPASVQGEREVLVHNFTSIGESTSLHYLPEHTRDGRDNKFSVEQFKGVTAENVERITTTQGLYLQKGDVVLVRSTNVPEYGDHFIVVTGYPIMKDHGMRPQEEAVMASIQDSELLDTFTQHMGCTLLKLNAKVTQEFYAFHNITFDDSLNVIFPEA